jgi:RNA polymerase sigma-70 factor (ECF subfamily)
MVETSARTSSFLERLANGRRDEASAWPGLDDALGELLSAARAKWQKVELSDEAFVGHVADRLPVEASVAEGLPRMPASDLYLACACAKRNPAAWAAFDAGFLGDLEAIWKRFNYVVSSPDDLRQLLHERLFLGTATESPRILEYTGEGSLRNWVRVVVLRTLINAAGRQSRELPVEDEALIALGGDVASAESAYFKERYGPELKRAFQEAVEQLTFRERNVLRYAFADNLSIDRIGEIYGIHRATASRWVSRAKERLADLIRAELVARLKVSESELASILRLTMSGFHVSLGHFLAIRA